MSRWHTARLPGELMSSIKRLVVSAAATRTPSAHMTCRDYSMAVASRFYFSNGYRFLYFLTVLSSAICVVWTAWNHWKIPSSVLFISLEICVSALLVFEVLLRMAAFRQRFWSKWCNVFDVFALVMSLVSITMYFNEEGVIGELEEVATDTLLAFRNAIQYMRLAIFLKNRSEQIGGTQVAEIDFDSVTQHGTEEDEEAVLLIGGVEEKNEDDADIDMHEVATDSTV